MRRLLRRWHNIASQPVIKDFSVPKFSAIVPAAGSGQRMQVGCAKQYLKINGRTIIEICLQVLLSCEKIQRVFVCVAADDQVWPTLAVSQHKKIHTVAGGATRAQSVLNGLLNCSPASNDEWVLVHDAARPCLTAQLLEKLIEALENDPVGGILATPARDTLKQTSPGQRIIEKTLDRSLVWLAQTPQMFRLGPLKHALQQALRAGQEVTDEAAAMELAGHRPRLVCGDARNLKVTLPEDLQLAAFWLGIES